MFTVTTNLEYVLRRTIKNHVNHGSQNIAIRQQKFRNRLESRAIAEITELKVIFDEEVAR